MSKLLPVNWFVESPIDFEHKHYILLSYLQEVDSKYIIKVVSPHLLHMETMLNEMNKFHESYELMKKNFEKNRYIYVFRDNPKLEGENNELIDEILQIVDFSVPLLKNKIEHGYFILKKHKQVLY